MEFKSIPFKYKSWVLMVEEEEKQAEKEKKQEAKRTKWIQKSSLSNKVCSYEKRSPENVCRDADCHFKHARKRPQLVCWFNVCCSNATCQFLHSKMKLKRL